MSTNKIEIQDGSGNVYYPKTSIDSVIYNNDVSIEEKIRMLEYKLNELKSRLVDSINNKTGSSLTSNSTVDEMAAIINSIKTLEQATADANATASNILVDKTAYVNGTKVTGTMPNKGAVTASLNCGGSYTIPAGYHNGSGKVTANSLASQTQANATASQILSGKTAWVNGNKITGTATIESMIGVNFAWGTANCSYDASRKESFISLNLNFTPKVIFGITGLVGANGQHCKFMHAIVNHCYEYLYYNTYSNNRYTYNISDANSIDTSKVIVGENSNFSKNGLITWYAVG